MVMIRAFDLLTIVIPPALPAAMSIGISFALNRLKKQQIFCISPTRINIAGKIDLVVFDKTGTLTEEGLDVLGVQAVESKFSIKDQEYDAVFTSLHTNVCDFDESLKDYSENGQDAPPILHALACCHSLRRLREELIGDPMDLKMFEFADCKFVYFGLTTLDV